MMNPFQQEQLKQLMDDPRGAAQKAGYQIPDELMGDPKQMVMHLVNTGQVSSPMLQRIMPMIRMMGGK